MAISAIRPVIKAGPTLRIPIPSVLRLSHFVFVFCAKVAKLTDSSKHNTVHLFSSVGPFISVKNKVKSLIYTAFSLRIGSVKYPCALRYTGSLENLKM